MKIQTKMGITSLTLILGLLFSSGLFFSRIFTVYQLKDYAEDTVELELSMHRFIDRNLSLFTEKGTPITLAETWFNELILFNGDLNRVFDSPSVRLLSQGYRQLLSTRKNSWDELVPRMLDPLQSEMNRFSGSALSREGNDRGFYMLLNEKEEAGDRDAVEQIQRIRRYQEDLHIFLSTYSFKIETLIEKAEEEVEAYTQESIILTLGTVTLIILLSLIVSLRVSNDLVRRIIETNKQVQDITQGRLRFEERKEGKGKDEFDELLHHYQTFSSVLSDRLDSLKYLLQDIGNSLGNQTSIEELQETIVELGMDSVGADSGMLFLADAESESLKLVRRAGFCPPPFLMDKKITMNRSNVENYYEAHEIDRNSPVFGSILTGGGGVFVKDNLAQGELPHNQDPYEWLFISSLLALPLIVSNRILGMLVFYKTRQGETFSDLDYTFFQAYTDYTAQSVDNVYKYRTLLENREIQREIDVAAGIQKRLLPSVLPAFDSGAAGISSLPARGISGDYFDAVRLDEKRILYTVCDVAGKGVPASMLMIMIRTILHTISHRHKAADTLLRELNFHIAGRIGVDQYATMAVFILNTEAGEISYSNAAHHPLYLYRSAEKQFRSFDTEGLPIGVDKQGRFGHKRIKLNRGDYIFLFTDGLPEARNRKGEELSNEKLLRFLMKNVRLHPEELTQKVSGFIKDYSQGAKQHDDQTFLALQLTPSKEPAAV